MNVISKYFFRGILILLPIVVTVYLVAWVFSLLSPVFEGAARLLPIETWGWLQTTLGVAVSIVLVTVVGAFASNWVGAWLLGMLERLLDRLPLVKLLHGSIKDLLGAFVGDKKSFDKPVLVSLTEDGSARVAGFITRDDLAFLGAEGHVAVYLPQCYNFAGNLVIVPRDRVQAVSATSSDVMSFLVSGGVSKQEGAAK